MNRMTAGMEWKYGALWALANVMGWSAAMGVPIITGFGNYYIWLILSGLLIGLAQWLVLSLRFSRSVWLIPAYGLGWYLGLSLGFSLGFLRTPEPLSIGIAGGAFVGAMQWFMLRHRMHCSVIWLPAMIISSLIGCCVGILAGNSAYIHGLAGVGMAYVIGGAVAGAVIGVLSGMTIVMLMRNNALRSLEPHP